MSQGKFEKKSLEYGEHETKFVAHLILKIQKDCHEQQFILGKGLKEFKEEAPPAVKVELKQMHQRTCFRAITVAELTRIERQWAQEGLMLLTRKRSGKVKGRLVYNGKPTRDWISKEDKSSPTVANDALMITCAIDTFEKWDIMSLDVPNAFIQTDAPIKKIGERVVMKIRGRLVDWLVEMAPNAYKNYIVIENGNKVLYLVILKVIYGMLEASLLWYRKLREDLEMIGFKFNPYDAFVANRWWNKQQPTIRFHVDDILSSHVDAKVNDKFAKWAQGKYGAIKDVEITRGRKHTFLGMELDFSDPGIFHVKQNDQKYDIVSSWPEKFKDNENVLTPASFDLFVTGGGRLLSDERREIFHSVVVKALFILSAYHCKLIYLLPSHVTSS